MTLDNVKADTIGAQKTGKVLPVDVIDGVSLPDDAASDRCFTLFTSSHENLTQGSISEDSILEQVRRSVRVFLVRTEHQATVCGKNGPFPLSAF